MKRKKRFATRGEYFTLQPDLDPIDLKSAKREVKRLRSLISAAKRHGNRRMAKYLQFVLDTSPSAEVIEIQQRLHCRRCSCIRPAYVEHRY